MSVMQGVEKYHPISMRLNLLLTNTNSIPDQVAVYFFRWVKEGEMPAALKILKEFLEAK